MNIKDQILECASGSRASEEDFAFSLSSDDTRKNFLNSIRDFLGAETYIEAERRCRELYTCILTLHDKYPILFPTVDRLNVEELYGTYGSARARRRLHFCHQAHVFLLGLYLYHNFESLRVKIKLEMQRTTATIIRNCPYPPFKYSGGSEYGEFLYRWRLAALCHDIGTGIQNCEGKEDKISQCLGRLPFENRVKSFDQLCETGDCNLLRELDRACSEVSLPRYMEYQKSNPFPDNVYHDHGIVGALIFLRLMHEEYSRHLETPISRTRFGKVFWHPDILSHSILQIAIAIAMHNLEKHKKALEMCAKNVRIFDMDKRPFAWLLKTADLLQEWDKPKREDERNDIPYTDLKLRVSEPRITVENFPTDRLENAQNILKYYVSPTDTIAFEY